MATVNDSSSDLCPNAKKDYALCASKIYSIDPSTMNMKTLATIPASGLFRPNCWGVNTSKSIAYFTGLSGYDAASFMSTLYTIDLKSGLITSKSWDREGCNP